MPLPFRRKKAAAAIDYAVLTGLVAVAVLGAVALAGDRIRSLLAASEETVGDGVAGLPLPETPPPGGGGTGGPPPPAPVGQGVWTGDGAFALTPASTPQSRAFTLTNVGQGILQAGAPQIAGPGAAGFAILSSDCGALPPGDSCQVLVQAAAAANGAADATLSVPGVPNGVLLSRIAAGFEPLLAWTTIFSAAVSGAPGEGPLPRVARDLAVLENQGFAPATGIAPALSGPQADAFQILSTTCGAVLLPGGSCTVEIEARASDNGFLEAILSSGGPLPATAPAQLFAAGFVPQLAWSGQTDLAIDAPTALPATAQQTLTLTNTGTLPATGIAPAVGGDPAFALVSTTCGAALAPGAACEATVSFIASADVSSAAAQISAGGVPGAIATLSGTATGFAPALAWSGTTTFAIDGTPGPEPLPRTAQQTFTLTNAGTAPATGLSVGASGAGFDTAGTTCTTTLDVAESCTITIRASAEDNATFAGTLSSGGATPATQPLSAAATGFAPALAWSGTSTFAIDGTPGPQPLPRTAQQTFTLTNSGTAPATGLAVGVSGAGFDLAGTTCTTTLAVGASCAFTVQASATTDGAFAGTLSSGGATPATQTLSATAAGFAAVFAFDPYNRETNALSAPTLPGPTRTMVLRNTGTLAATPAPASLAGPGAASFEIVSDGCAGAPVAPGGSCAIGVRMSAAATPGLHEAILASGAGGAATLAIDGTHAVPWLRFMSNGDSLTLPVLGNQPANPVLGTNVINLWNVGGASVSLAGFSPATQVLSSNTGAIVPLDGGTLTNRCELLSSLAPGEFCALRVQRRATDNGTFSSTLSLSAGFATPPGTVRQTLPVSFTAAGLAPAPTIAFDAPSTFTLASGAGSSTQNRLFRNRGALPYAGIAAGDFTVEVGAQPPGGGVSASVATGPATGRCGTNVSSLGPNATCNVGISVARPASTIGTTTLLVRHVPSGTETTVTLVLN